MKSLISKNVKWFILIFIASCVVWFSVFSYLNKPKDYERLQVFITADLVENDAIKEKCNKDNLFKDVLIYSCGEEDTYYTTMLETSGIISSDILIVNETLVKTKGATTSFIELDQSYLNKYNIDLSKYELTYVDDKAYGIVIYDNAKNINLIDKISYNDSNKNNRYCICLNNISYHIDKYSIQKDKTTDYAFKVLYSLLNK